MFMFNGERYEDGSPVLDICSSASDFLYLLMRYVFHILNGLDHKWALETLGRMFSDCF